MILARAARARIARGVAADGGPGQKTVPKKTRLPKNRRPKKWRLIDSLSTLQTAARVIEIDVSITASQWTDPHSGLAEDPEVVVRRAIDAVCMRHYDELQTLEVGIVLCDDAEIRRLNHDWRGKDAPTDTLSFPAGVSEHSSPPGAAQPLGDIVVAYETAAADAAKQHKSMAHHLSHLVAHGCLHLFGFDHATEAEAQVMEDEERVILASLGIDDPYTLG